MAQDIDHLIRVQFCGDRIEATLRIAAGTDPAYVDEMHVAGAAEARGLQHSEALTEALRQAVAEYDPDAPDDLTRVIARGTPPRHGEDGRFELEPGLEEIRERAAKLRRKHRLDDPDPAADELPEGAANHYDRSTLMLVKPGQTVGRILPHTEGVDGVDVCGEPVPAADGKPVPIEIDHACIERTPDDRLLAKVGGLLLIHDGRLSITDDLEIHDYIDFSTGNVEFEGNIIVHKGVRDCFVVRAGGSITIGELVEAATIETGSDLRLARGITGREKGRLRAGRDLHAKFMDSADVLVARDLVVEREMSHCRAVVWRDVRSPGATLIGGECTVAGSAHLGQLGTESGTHTIVRMGRLGSVDRLIREAMLIAPAISRRSNEARQELEAIRSGGPRVVAEKAETIADLEQAIEEANARLDPLREGVRRAITVAQNQTIGALVVHERILPGAIICIAGRRATIRDGIAGPVRITADDTGEPVVIDLQTSSRSPLSAWAAMDLDRESPNLDDVKRTLGLAA